jgi:TolB protein
LTSGQDIWRLQSVDFPAYISVVGQTFAPPDRQEPYPAYVFLRMNFDCVTDTSLIELYSGEDLGLTFVFKEAGYTDIQIEDLQGHKYLATLLGPCWLAAPIPKTRAEDQTFLLNFMDLPPFKFETKADSQTTQSKITFISDRDETDEVFISDPDGGNPIRLTTDFTQSIDPAWSSDGQLIAYVSTKGGSADVIIIDKTGNKLKNLTESPEEDGGPAWSPRDDWIALHTYADNNWDVFAISMDGNKHQNLTDHPNDDMYPTWSPDGEKIAFQSNRDGNWEIYLMSSDGTEVERLTSQSGDDILPSWSPVGDQISFWSKRSGLWRLYYYQIDDSSINPITTYENPGPVPSRAAWSPDGDRILVSLMQGNYLQLFSMKTDGSEPERLTDLAANDFMPDW